MSINEKGYWEGLEAESQHAFDPYLSYAMLMFFKNVLFIASQFWTL